MESILWGLLVPRADEEEAGVWRRQFGSDFNGDGRPDRFSGFRLQGNSSTSLQEELRFAPAKSIRTSTIILSVFNIIAAFATAVGILWDGYAREKRNNEKFRFRTSGFSFIGPAETFPLVLSCGIVIQGIVFAVAQSTGLEGTLVLGCTITSQLMLPAVFIAPYIQLIFGLEVTLRAFRRQPFLPKSKWAVTICLATIGGLLAVSYIITHFIRPPNFCFASLFFFVQPYAQGCFAIFLIIGVVLTCSMVVVFVKLHRNSRVDSTERVAASRMVYYMAVAVISAALILPFFAVLAFTDMRETRNESLQLSMVASVVANVSGLMTGGLHLFFRSNTLSTIGPKCKEAGGCTEVERQNFKRGIRHWSPRENNSQPSPLSTLQRMNSNDTLINSERSAMQMGEKEYEGGRRVNPLRSNAVFPSVAVAGLAAPEAVMAKSHGRKGSYSLFPGSNPNAKPVDPLSGPTYDQQTTAMIFNDADLKPPAPVTATRHRRDSSMASHATVQIGIRLSNVEDMPPLDSKYFDAHKVHNLDCPNAINKALSPTKRPSPLSNIHHEDSEGDDDQNDAASSAYSDEDDTRKTLPGLPGEHEKTDCTLSPVVYNPNSPTKASKVTSPRSAGLSALSPQRSPRENRDVKVHKPADWV